MEDNAPTVATAKRRIKSLRSLRMPEDKIRSIIRSEFPKAIVKQIYNNISTFTSSLSATQPTQTKTLPTNDTLVKMAKEAAKNAEIERAKTDKPRKRTITRTTSRPTHSDKIDSFEKLLSTFEGLKSLKTPNDEICKIILKDTDSRFIRPVRSYLRLWVTLSPAQFKSHIAKEKWMRQNRMNNKKRRKQTEMPKVEDTTPLFGYSAIMAFERTVEAKKTGPSYEQFEYGISDWDN